MNQSRSFKQSGRARHFALPLEKSFLAPHDFPQRGCQCSQSTTLDESSATVRDIDPVASAMMDETNATNVIVSTSAGTQLE
jgi:hypothetical protein